MKILIYPNYEQMSVAAARFVADCILDKPRCVLGLATGETPIGLYAELARLHHEEGLDFSGVTTFNLDEYCDLPKEDSRSFHSFMWRHLFSHVNVDPRKVHTLKGTAPDLEEECRRYESLIKDTGGIDLQVLGIGVNGHIGFNEPGSPPDGRTRVVTLTAQTVEINRAKEKVESLPGRAVSMGIGTIMDAKQILLLAAGRSKADIVHRATRGPVTPSVPASILQNHANALFMLDLEAASLLETGFLNTPCAAGECTV
ncbi:MAG: glucosamine-6-phosphate deaminase [Firmicutes bacterium]|nr:glucosamine-6-phosphate deaminase [Bacillota bacterium]